ncbi:unnamed protein product [Mytilus coruscus]|uniref:Uncharacterized protein n=1 Tax=Mytilus coruscus TaxID=42192 RepID=A0A6J8F4G4_MYTCO|nr:unnamed protein product [Mytilus coruscus]
MKASKEATSRKAKRQYGKECIQAENDIPPQQLETIKQKFYTTEIDITPSEIKKIETETTSQNISTNWSEQRKKRLTSSNFGRIVKRNSKLPVAKLVSSLLYCTFSGNKSTRFGLSGKSYNFGIHSFHEETNSNKWYKGVVITVLKKLDGDEDAVYEVLYEGCDDSYEKDHLAEDFRNSSMKFTDI